MRTAKFPALYSFCGKLVGAIIFFALFSLPLARAQVLPLGGSTQPIPRTQTPSRGEVELIPLTLRADTIPPERMPAPVEGIIPLEAPIDPAEYIVGPGDKFLLKLWGEYELEAELTLLPTGELLLPDYGPVQLAGLTLAEATDTVYKKMSELYRQLKLSFSLKSMRNFRIHLLGEVALPGLYTLNPTNRLTDLLRLAGEITPNGDMSSIMIIERDDTTRVNLYDYYSRGKLTANPFMHEALVVFVPPLEPAADKVYLLSSRSKGYFRMLPQETLWNFLLRTRAITRYEQFQSTLVLRDAERFSMQTPEELYTFTLTNGDTVLVSAITDSVYVVGEVKGPGAYPYMPGLSIREYLALAGGTTAEGSLRRIRVIRRSKALSGKKAGYLQAGDIIQVRKKGLAVIGEYMGIVTPIASIILTAYAIGLFGGD